MCPNGSDCSVASPDGRIHLTFALNSEGCPSYAVTFDGDTVVRPSLMGFEVADPADPDFHSGFSFAARPRYGERRLGLGTRVGRKRHHRQPLHRSQRPAHQKSSSGADRLLNIAFRVYDDGIAFRYIFPAQGSDSLVITDEYSQFAMPSDLTASGGFPATTTPRNMNTTALA